MTVNQLLEDQRVRVAIFALITLGLLFLFFRSTSATVEDRSTPAVSQEQQAQGGGGGTPEGVPAPTEAEEYLDPEYDPEAPLYPEYDSSAPPLPPAPDLKPENDALPSRGDAIVATPTSKDVVKYFTAYNTFTWLEPVEIFTERAVKAGAVPNSEAAQSSIRGILYDSCMAAKCSTEPLKVSNIVINEKEGTVTADVLVRTRFGGETFEEVMNCSSQLAQGPAIEKGKFSKTFCLGPEG